MSLIATRIAEILRRRLVQMERRLSDTVFKTVPQRVATALVTEWAFPPQIIRAVFDGNRAPHRTVSGDPLLPKVRIRAGEL